MTRFTQEEINLICIYDTGNRKGAIYELRNMMRYLMPDESDLKAAAESAVCKLEEMTDADYDDMMYGMDPPGLTDLLDEDSSWRFAAAFPPDDISPDNDIE